MRTPTAADRVKAWLITHKRTQSWLAHEVGVDKSVLWRWLESGAIPRVDHALEIERVTGVSAGFWLPARRRRAA